MKQISRFTFFQSRIEYVLFEHAYIFFTSQVFLKRGEGILITDQIFEFLYFLDSLDLPFQGFHVF